MPVKFIITQEKGWKKEQNNRHGNCLVVKFIDCKTNKCLFRWAPKYDDKPLFDAMWSCLKKYDEEQLKRLEVRK